MTISHQDANSDGVSSVVGGITKDYSVETTDEWDRYICSDQCENLIQACKAMKDITETLRCHRGDTTKRKGFSPQ